MPFSKTVLGTLALVPFAVYLAGCERAADPPSSDPASGVAEPSPVAATAVSLPDRATTVDYPYTIEMMDATDLDGDGLLDLTLSSHVESQVVTIFQQAPREFGDPWLYPTAGYHPNGVVALDTASGQRPATVALSAEVPNRLRLYEVFTDQPPVLVHQVVAPSPRHTRLLDWPGVDRALAMASKATSVVRIFPGFGIDTPTDRQPLEVTVGPRLVDRIAGVAVAPLTRDGPSHFLVAVPGTAEGRLVAVGPAPEGEIGQQVLWTFDATVKPSYVLPVDFDQDGDTDLFVLGETSSDAFLLVNDGMGAYELETFGLSTERVHAAALAPTADGGLQLWVGGPGRLELLQWGAARSAPPDRQVFNAPRKGWLRLLSADIDGDGNADLLIGSSISAVPLTLIFGPLDGQTRSQLSDWLGGLATAEASTSPPLN